ncbi:MAG: hypothetical protein JWO74_2823 [Solirubrobacterales bacterium]|jgi:hypothetical protein|nr:hypothetical protein [Solirubrobacterales bacterium]
MHISDQLSWPAAVGAVALLAGCGASSAHHAAPPPPPSAGHTASAALVEVPALVGRRQEEAHRIAARAGLRVRWTGFAGKLANGRYDVSCAKVFRQSPVAGERRPRGAQIAVIEIACHVPKTAPHGV